MTDNRQLLKALRYMNEKVNQIYRLAENRDEIFGGLDDNEIESAVKSIRTIVADFEYIISDRYKARCD